MEEEDRGGQPGDGNWPNAKCIINIFCCEKKHDAVAYGKDDDGNCVINIFCGDKKPYGPDCGKNDGNCVINIFCKDKKICGGKTPDNKCDNDSW